MEYLNRTVSFCLWVSILIFLGCKTDVAIDEPGKEITLLLEPSPGNPRNSEGDFIQLNDGRLLFVYTHFTGGAGDHASAYLAGRYSSDGGKTWTNEDVMMLPNEGGMNIMSVSMLRLVNGDLALFYLRKNSETDCIPFLRISKDEAQTWSEPIRCIEKKGYHVVNNDRLIQLPGGRLIFPTALHGETSSGMNRKGQIMCYYSDDNGKSWIESIQVSNPDSITLQEPGIVELIDGKMMLFCRTDAGVQYFSYSNDQGASWSPIKVGNIKSPLSPASIERIPATGDLLLVWNNNYKEGRDGGKRTPFNLAISKDEGESWQKTKSIASDPEGWYCYTAIEFIDDHVLLGHCAGDRRTGNGLAMTNVTRLSLNWIYQDTTPEPNVTSDKDGTIVLSSDDEQAKIYYTLDGSLPKTEKKLLYRKPISISQRALLTMQAFSTGKTQSQIVTSQIGNDIFQQAQELSEKQLEGLNYHYFEGEFSQTKDIKNATLNKSGISSQFSIAKSQSNESFAFLFDGYLKVPTDGLYTFYLESNDGSVLYLDDRILIDNDGAHGNYEKTASISLRKGMHKIALSYFQQGGGKGLKVCWQGEEFDKSEIPSSVLFHEEPSFQEAVSWLQFEAHRIIRASKRTMNDGMAAFPPQVGLGYEAFWLRDYAYTLEGSVKSYSNKELIDACNLFVSGISENGAGVDCIKFDGTNIYKPGFGTMGQHPVADGSQFTVNVAWHTYQKTKDKKFLATIADDLIKTMNAVPRNPETHLVHIIPGEEQERCPYGFTDTVGKQGDLLFCSLLYVQAARRLSDLLRILGRREEADHWENESIVVTNRIQQVFWDNEIGLLRAATVRCKEPDIWGSAFAVYLGVINESQSKSIATYFQQNYNEIVHKGQVRHLPGGVYWEKARQRDEYQNGAFWATPTGWFVYALDIVDPKLADQTVIDMVEDFSRNGANEWIFETTDRLPNYLASASLPLSGIRAMIKRRE